MTCIIWVAAAARAPYSKQGSHGGKMCGSRTTLGILLVASITCGSVQAAPRQPACIEIMASCEQAGFVRGDAKAGDRLFMDCVIPILRATPERSRASKPLPQVDPKLVADCKAQNPNFGQRVARPPQPGEPAMQPHNALVPATIPPSAYRLTGFMERPAAGHSGLSPANFTTLAHFSVSSAMNFPKSAGEPDNAVPPRSARRALIVELARPALISVFNVATISEGVCLGAPRPYHALYS